MGLWIAGLLAGLTLGGEPLPIHAQGTTSQSKARPARVPAPLIPVYQSAPQAREIARRASECTYSPVALRILQDADGVARLLSFEARGLPGSAHSCLLDLAEEGQERTLGPDQVAYRWAIEGPPPKQVVLDLRRDSVWLDEQQLVYLPEGEVLQPQNLSPVITTLRDRLATERPPSVLLQATPLATHALLDPILGVLAEAGQPAAAIQVPAFGLTTFWTPLPARTQPVLVLSFDLESEVLEMELSRPGEDPQRLELDCAKARCLEEGAALAQRVDALVAEHGPTLLVAYEDTQRSIPLVPMMMLHERLAESALVLPPVLHLEPSPPAVQRDPDQVRYVILAELGALRPCYLEAQAREPTLEGVVELVVRIEADGSVSQVSAGDASTLDDAQAVACMLEHTRTLQFDPVPGAGPLVIRFPLAYSPPQAQ